MSLDIATALFGLVRGVMGLSAIVGYVISWTTGLAYRVFGPVPCLAGVIVGIGVACVMRKPAELSGASALRELIAMRHSQSRLAFTVNAVRAALLLSLIVLRWTMRLVPRGAYFAIWLYGWGASAVDLSVDMSYLALDVYHDIVFLHSLALTFCQWVVVFYSMMARLCTFSTWTYMVLAAALRAAADFLINVPANIRHSLLAATAFYDDLMYTHSGDVEDCQAAFDWWVADVKDALPECLVDAFEGLRRFDCAWLAWATRIVTCFFCQLLKTIVFMIEVPFLRSIQLCAIAIQWSAKSCSVAAAAFAWFIACLDWALGFMKIYVLILQLARVVAESMIDDYKEFVEIYNHIATGTLSCVAGSLDGIVEFFVSDIPSGVCKAWIGFVPPQHRKRGKARAAYAVVVWLVRTCRRVDLLSISQLCALSKSSVSAALDSSSCLPTWFSSDGILVLPRAIRPAIEALVVAVLVFHGKPSSTSAVCLPVLTGFLSYFVLSYFGEMITQSTTMVNLMTTFGAPPSLSRLSFEMDESIKVEIESISIIMDGLDSRSSPSHRSLPEISKVSGSEQAAVSLVCRPASEPVMDRGRFMARAPSRAASSDSSIPRLRPRRELKQAAPRAALRSVLVPMAVSTVRKSSPLVSTSGSKSPLRVRRSSRSKAV